ncbi:MAG: butyrate kinase [Candidatus Marinimicrobia bacterium]|nr:butyrate kinase [Candidatus Neomarinimicrobiota bacterium]
MSERVLTINPGSTSTKMAVFTRKKVEFELKVSMDENKISRGNVYDEFPFRKEQIKEELKKHEIDKIDIVIGRGGILKPLKSGAYPVCDSMINDLKTARYGNHASNLGGPLAAYFGKAFKCPAYIIDPVVVDEMNDLARISGVPGIERHSVSHALNIKATTRRVCDRNNWNINNRNFIVVHMGGGITVCAMENGRNIDVNNALLGMGPFSPERAGAIPLKGIMDLVYKKKMDEPALKRLLTRESGLKGYLGTNDVRIIVRRIKEGDKKAKLILDAMLYQLRKEIGAMAAVLNFDVCALIITGGIVYSDYVKEEILTHLGKQFSIIIYPGENELGAMADGGFRIIDGEMNIYNYENCEV